MAELDIKTALMRIVERQDLTTDEMISVMRQIMTGQCDDAQIGAFLTAMRMKSESISEIVGAVTVMRELATGIKVNDKHAVDIVGTGGDGANLFNVSSASAFVVAAAGGVVAKHGGRGVSSKSGSADVIEAMGISLDMTPEQVERAINEIGVGFMFAPSHHSAMKYAMGPRKSLGMRTIFNILGPLTNPAGVPNQVIGVFNKALVRPVAEVMQRLGSRHVLVVSSKDGLDEISLATETYACELKDGELTNLVIKPEDLGIESQVLLGLEVGSPEESWALIKDALGKRETANGKKAADMLALNAGAAIYVSGVANTLKNGVAMAEDAIYSGLALEKVKELVNYSICLTEDANS